MIGFNPEREDRLIEQKIEKIKQALLEIIE